MTVPHHDKGSRTVVLMCPKEDCDGELRIQYKPNGKIMRYGKEVTMYCFHGENSCTKCGAVFKSDRNFTMHEASGTA